MLALHTAPQSHYSTIYYRSRAVVNSTRAHEAAPAAIPILIQSVSANKYIHLTTSSPKHTEEDILEEQNLFIRRRSRD